MSFLEMRLTQYVDCIDLSVLSRIYRFSWRRHTDRRVELASRLAECIACKYHRLRRCTRSITRNYRRLEDYAKAIGIIQRQNGKWVGYGKLIEYTVYFTYHPSKDKKKKNARRVEVRVYIPIPLHFFEYAKLWDIAEEIAYYHMESNYPYLVDFADEIKDGVRPCTDYDISEEGIAGHWCNGIIKVRLDKKIWSESIAFKLYPEERIYGNMLRYESDLTWCDISP